MCSCVSFLFLFSAFRERGRERNIDVREKHQLVASYTCQDQGLNPQFGYVPWPGIEPATIWLWDATPTNWATAAKALLRLISHLGFFFFAIMDNAAINIQYISNGILLSHKKKEILLFAPTWMELEEHSAKWNKSEKDKYCMISFISGILRKPRSELLDTESRLVVAIGGG